MEDKIKEEIKFSQLKNQVSVQNTEQQEREINQAFSPIIDTFEALTKQYGLLVTKELSEDLCIEAKELRNQLVKVRTGIAKIHKSQKAFFLAGGKFVDAWKTKETEPVTQMESKLKEIENHFILLEEERYDKRFSERLALIHGFGIIITEPLKYMSEEMFQIYYDSKEKDYKLKQIELKQIEAERLEKIEEAKAEQKRIKDENEKLKTERAESEKKAQKEEADRKRIEDLRIVSENKKKATEEAERKKKEVIRLAKEKVILDAKNKVIAEQKAKTLALENKIKAQKKEEERREKERNDLFQAELNKGDAEKVKDLKNELQIIKSKYSFKSAKNKKMYSDVGGLIDKVVKFIK